MIPYFISFILLGIPLMWVEWGIGRRGGRFGHGTVPRMFDGLWRHPLAKYLGVMGIVMPLIVFIYYTVIVGWMLGFSFFSIIGDYFSAPGTSTTQAAEEVTLYLRSFQNIHEASVHGGWVGFLFYGITLGIIVWVLSRGISGGIEKLALYGMPILFIFAIILVFRVLTLPPTDVGSPGQGLAFIWTPDWSALGNARVWIAAAGQIFFTLSLGMGSIHTYSSFLSKDDDITLTGLATASTNEFAEVVIGGTLAIPAAVTFFGVTGAMALASQASFDFGIISMAVVLQGLPGRPDRRPGGGVHVVLPVIHRRHHLLGGAGFPGDGVPAGGVRLGAHEDGAGDRRARAGPRPRGGLVVQAGLPLRVGRLGRDVRAGDLRLHRDHAHPLRLRRG